MMSNKEFTLLWVGVAVGMFVISVLSVAFTPTPARPDDPAPKCIPANTKCEFPE